VRSFNVLLFTILSCSLSCAQAIDTLALKTEIENLKTGKDRKAFLQKTLDEDQKYRGNETNDSLDYEHLISVSYYFNKFGYPTKKDFGESAKAMWLVWVHNSFKEPDRLSFPLIRKGFIIGEIEQLDLRSYFLRQFYKFDDERYLTMPIKELLASCEVEVNDKISIKQIVEAKAKIDSLDKIKVVATSHWKADDILKTYDVNGEQVSITHDGALIRIVEKENGKFYLLQLLHKDYEGRPTELTKIASSKFRYKHKTESGNYFEFLKDRILYKNKTEILHEYKKAD